MVEQSKIRQRITPVGVVKSRWNVDLEQNIAWIEGVIYVGFCKLHNGGFSIVSRRPIDEYSIDLIGYITLIEEAKYMINEKLNLQKMG